MADQPTIQSRIIAALQAKIPNPKCPLCAHTDFEVPAGTFAFHYKITSQFGSSIHNTAHPCAAMICQTCGNTLFISLAILSPSLAKEVS